MDVLASFVDLELAESFPDFDLFMDAISIPLTEGDPEQAKGFLMESCPDVTRVDKP